jgi:hypothetical protein
MHGLGIPLNLADLSGARDVTNDEPDEEADSLQGATKPNGQKYDDWLTDIENRGKMDGLTKEPKGR